MTENSGRLFIKTPCPDSPNCVSSLSGDEKSRVTPYAYEDSLGEARERLLEILSGFDRARIVESEKDYIHAEFTSSLFRFVDDVAFYFPSDQKIVHVKSASRTGYYDFGVNRKRVERIRQKFEDRILR